MTKPAELMRHPQPPRSKKLPDDIYIGQVASLYAGRGSVIMGLATTFLCGCVTIYETRQPIVGFLVAAFVLVGLVRQHSFVHFQRERNQLDAERAHEWERLYTFGVSIYLFLLGAWTFAVMAVTDDPFPIIVALVATISTAYGIPFRNFAFERGTQIQTAAVAFPLFVAVADLGGRYFLFGLLVLTPTFIFILGSAARLRVLLLDELLYRHKSEQTAAQLDMAIGSMPLGLCMISPDQRVLVANDPFRAMLGLAPGQLLTDFRIATLARWVRLKKIFAASEYQRFEDFLRRSRTPGASVALQIDDAQGRSFDIALSWSESGNAVLIVQDITDRRMSERAIDQMARFDAVTGLPNRRSFETALQDSIRTCDSAAVLFIDLDDFKRVNDTLGHRRGDAYLVEVGARLHRNRDSAHFISRWGGDEFVVLMRNAGEAEAAQFARRLIQELSRPCMIEGYEILAGASVGIAVSTHGDPPADMLLQRADMALYAAKAKGRCQFHIYEEGMNAAAQERRKLELDVRHALATHKFEIHYQPVVDLASGAIVACEALARWIDPERGPVPPSEFVPIVEELGLVNEFGEWVLDLACRTCATWPLDLRVAVNLSALQIRNDHLLARKIEKSLADSGLPGGRLELEITETSLLEDRDSTLGFLNDVRKLGVRIALDDFGTGYSSLSYLMSFPLDKVKIDRSFVSALGRDQRATVLVDNVAKLGSQLGMTVTAEGIETEAQAEFLRALHNVQQGQGFLFGRPVPADEFLMMLEAGRSRPKRLSA